ncbi:hypothetical protein HNY73_009653 [Argiope bruennichi]|uniref:C2H2-type domain-containing protein n=1 Tax=Argiope bruennichi TaxID=94029 RepID=A0A8T0FCY9_ARGBR|nr:hypothetical protein HNY73_009653 [Argiope bruennichi]
MKDGEYCESHFYINRPMSEHATMFLATHTSNGIEQLLREQNPNKHAVNWEEFSLKKWNRGPWKCAIKVPHEPYRNPSLGEKPKDNPCTPPIPRQDASSLLHWKIHPDWTCLLPKIQDHIHSNIEPIFHSNTQISSTPANLQTQNSPLLIVDTTEAFVYVSTTGSVNKQKQRKSASSLLLATENEKYEMSLQGKNTFYSAQLWTPCDLPYFDNLSDIRLFDIQTEENVSFIVSSENAESCYRPENDFPEAYNLSPAVMESTGVDEERQRILGVSDLIYTTCSENDELSRQENNCLSLNNDKRNFMDSVWTGHSDNCNVSEPRKLIVNPDFLPGSNEPGKGKIHVSEYITDEHTSCEIHSNVYSKSEKITANLEEHLSSKTYNNAVAGPSGICPQRKKFPYKLCPKEFNKKYHFDNHYRTHTGEKHFVCDLC